MGKRKMALALAGQLRVLRTAATPLGAPWAAAARRATTAALSGLRRWPWLTMRRPKQPRRSGERKVKRAVDAHVIPARITHSSAPRSATGAS